MKILKPGNISIVLAFLVLGVIIFYRFGRSVWVPVYQGYSGRKSVDDVMREFGPLADDSLRPAFNKVGLDYPPKYVSLLSFKAEKRMELWAKNDGDWLFVRDFEIKAASGKAGPKLNEGDWQVPEGIYEIEGLNPNSSFHLSMKLNYPNDFDKSHAKSDGRTALGGDIFIHGKAASVGCLAMGDKVAEQLFVLVNRVGVENVNVIIAPYDFRKIGVLIDENPSPAWISELYTKIDAELKNYVVN